MYKLPGWHSLQLGPPVCARANTPRASKRAAGLKVRRHPRAVQLKTCSYCGEKRADLVRVAADHAHARAVVNAIGREVVRDRRGLPGASMGSDRADDQRMYLGHPAGDMAAEIAACTGVTDCPRSLSHHGAYPRLRRSRTHPGPVFPSPPPHPLIELLVGQRRRDGKGAAVLRRRPLQQSKRAVDVGPGVSGQPGGRVIVRCFARHERGGGTGGEVGRVTCDGVRKHVDR